MRCAYSALTAHTGEPHGLPLTSLEFITSRYSESDPRQEPSPKSLFAKVWGTPGLPTVHTALSMTMCPRDLKSYERLRRLRFGRALYAFNKPFFSAPLALLTAHPRAVK